MKFSIIIPAYNVADYLEKCVKSVLIQEFKDYEIQKQEIQVLSLLGESSYRF